MIDAHIRRRLRRHLVDLCSGLKALDLPVLVLLECFDWRVALKRECDDVQLPLELQWRLAKHI